MAQSGPKSLFGHPRHSVGGVVASALISLLAWPCLTLAAQGPSFGVVTAPAVLVAEAEEPTATLNRQGDGVTITGSVAMLFNTGSFEGPNRAEKVNRARLTPDGVTISSGFEAMRTQLASLRAPASGSSTVPMPDAAPSVQVASIDPGQSAALGAIDQVVPMIAAAMPMSATGQLAYARETAPAIDPNFLTDKTGHEVSQKDLWCMATAIYFEARGESYRGQVAVGQVVMNRLAHPIYPKTICAVVYQNQQMRNACQFSFACDGIPETVTEPKSWAQAEEIAKGVINGSLYLPDVGKATHYHATYVYPDWAPRLTRLTKIGHHIFYKFRRA